MKTKFIEAEHDDIQFNWGKFMVAEFDEDEWERSPAASGTRGGSLLSQVGWTPRHLLVLDLQTGEGAVFMPGGLPSADLDKHRVWVCPMFEPFLNWLYKQDLSDLDALPSVIRFKAADAPPAMSGYRRKGQD